MKLKKQQKSYLIILAGFIATSLLYEIGFFIVKGHCDFSSTPFIIGGAGLAALIGVIASR